VTPRNASSRGGKRLYAWRDEKFWSVTTILSGGIPKPALPSWAAREAATFAVEHVEQVAALVDSGDAKAAADLIKGAPWRARDKAADLGTAVHAAVEALVLGKPAPDRGEDVAPFMEHFDRFVNDWNVTFTASEATVYSRAEKYAGTFDFTATIPRLADLGYSGDRCLGDLKTGKGVYPEVALQLAAYAHADFIGLPNGDEVPVPEVDCGIVLHLRPTGYRLIPARIDDEVFLTFKYAREVFRWAEDLSADVLGPALDAEAAA